MRASHVSLSVLALAAGVSTSSAAVLWDQLSTAIAPGNGFAAQQFEPAFGGAYDTVSMDDFTLSAPSTIQSVDFPMFYYNGAGPTTTWRIEIYSSPAAALASGIGLAGDVAHVTGLAGGQAAAIAPAFITLPVNIPLAAGTYWIGIIGVMNFTPNGQVAVMGESNIQGAQGVQVNPGGGFGLPGNVGPMVNGTTPEDMIFRLNGVPGPSSLALLGLGGLAAFRRRR